MNTKRNTTIYGLVLLLGVTLLSGCAAGRAKTVPDNACTKPAPTTNRMSDAIAEAEEILQDCPDRQDEIFLALLEVGKRNPGIENRQLILDMYKQLMEHEVVNVQQARTTMTRYFYTRFAAIDSVNERFSSLSDRALDRLSQAIAEELADKKVGLDEVSDAPEQYERAVDYAARMQDILESTKIQWSHLRKEQAQ